MWLMAIAITLHSPLPHSMLEGAWNRAAELTASHPSENTSSVLDVHTDQAGTLTMARRLQSGKGVMRSLEFQ
jgi:hypothetical protein